MTTRRDTAAQLGASHARPRSPQDVRVVSWYGEGSMPDPLVGVEVIKKSDSAATQQFGSRADASRFNAWLAE